MSPAPAMSQCALLFSAPRCHSPPPRNGQAHASTPTAQQKEGQPSWRAGGAVPRPRAETWAPRFAPWRLLACALASPHRPRGVAHPPAPPGCGLFRSVALLRTFLGLSLRGEFGVCFRRRVCVACERMDSLWWPKEVGSRRVSTHLFRYVYGR